MSDDWIPPRYAQNVFDWELATDAAPIYWVGPDAPDTYPDEPRFVVWEAWSNGQAMIAEGLKLHNAMKIVDAMRAYSRMVMKR